MTTVYVSIGNSDDKLTQEEWAEFWAKVDEVVVEAADRVYGVWQSNPNSRYQNACWAFEIEEALAQSLADSLNELRLKYHQDEVAWAWADTVFINNENTDVTL